MKRILIVERDTKYRRRTEGVLASLECDVVGLPDVEEAVRAMLEQMPELVIAVGDEPDETDRRLLRLAREGSRPVPVLVLTENGSTRGAIGYMDAGAYDYVAKPTDPGELLEVVRNILSLAGGSQPRATSVSTGASPAVDGETAIIGKSPEMIEIFKMIGRIAKSDAAVLVQGESGTGKELAARTIHENSRRAGKPFLAVNCAAIPETLLESELFGHEKGAFTGASYSRKGKFELSHGGTIFLDEIGDMSLPTQAKILRVLQEHTFERVGGERTLSSDTRLIAATNKSLVDCIDTNDFRVDLFYRLKVVSLFLPALRKRPGDLPLLVEHFIRKYRGQSKIPIHGISERAQALLEAQPWPGNVRELENAIQTGVVLNRTCTLDLEDFPFLHDRVGGGPEETVKDSLERLSEEVRKTAGVLFAHEETPGAAGIYHACLDAVERALVTNALEANRGNQVKASKALGISRNTLRSKLAPR